MGRIKNKTVKRAARELIEKYYSKLTDDFHYNKKIVEQVSDVSSKRLRNKIAGFTTHLMSRIARGPVRGISLKIQEEQREKLFDKPPSKSKVQIGEFLEAEQNIITMLRDQGFGNLVDQKKVGKKEMGLMS